MHVAHKFEQVSISIHKDRLVTPLKQVAAPALAHVDPASESKGQIVHPFRQGDISSLEQKMNVVAHQTKCMDAVTKTTGSFLEKEIQAVSIGIAEKDRLPGISPKDDVIESARDVYSQFSGHRLIINHSVNMSTLEA